jgi:3-oxoadipate enol-lactonase
MIVKLNSLPVHYWLHGPRQAPALVLIHGFPFNHNLWQGQVGPLSRSFRVLTYDLRGMGQSALGPAPQPLEAYVDDLEALMAHVGFSSAALCGLSMGGYIALRAVQRQPGRYWALALCDTRADADSDEGKLNRAAGIKAIQAKGPAPFIEGMLPKLLWKGTLKSKPAVAGFLRRMMGSCPAQGMANALSAMAGRGDTRPALARFPRPLLCLAGRHDAIAPPDVARSMAVLAKRGSSVVIPRAAHLSCLENPSAFNAVLLRFLKRATP